jgi:hypothetical protein
VTLSGAGATGDSDLGLPLVSSLASFGEDGCGRVYVASNSGPVYRLSESGACVAGGQPPSSGPDSTPPRLSILRSGRQRSLRTAVVRLSLRCDEQCRVTLTGSIALRRTKRARAAVALRLLRVRRTLAAGVRVRIAMRVPKRTRQAVGRALRRKRLATASIRVLALDGAANARRRTARVRIVR